LVGEYGYLALEYLQIQGMVKNRRLANSIADASWGEFVGQLAYAEMEAMPLRVRERRCPRCDAYHDRDRNVAITVLISCCAASTVGTTGRHAGGLSKI
jgi:putative transposase